MYYTLWAKERITTVHDALLKKFGESPFDDNWLKRPSQDHRITTRLNIGAYLRARTESLLAHATQVDPTSKWWFGLDDNELAQVYPWEDWILAKSIFGEIAPGVIESDLFEGIRADVGVSA
jgi:mycothiol S-conjugate amidase